MNSIEQSLIEEFLNQADYKVAKSNQRFFKQGEDSCSKHDILLGIPMPKIKEYVKNLPFFELDTLAELVKSEYNEARVLGWALLARDFPETQIIKYFVLKFSPYCGNWNVVDFAAPISSKIILKNNGKLNVQSLGYEVLYTEANLWTYRFAIVMSLPLVQRGELNYAIDIVERNLDSKEELILKPCGWILREIGKQNKNILTMFIQENKDRISPITKQFALEHFTKEEKDLI